MISTSLSEKDANPAGPKKENTPRRKRLKRWTIGVAIALLILGGAITAYILVNAQVTPLALPSVPANLTADQIGLANWQEYQQALPAHPLENSLLPATPQATPALAALE